MTKLPNYKSSVLLHPGCEDDCKVCAFLAGERSETAMLETIRILDLKLAESQTAFRNLVRIFPLQIPDSATKVVDKS